MTSLTVMVIVVVVLPPVLVAVTVNVEVGVMSDGVPEISPFVVEKLRPLGSCGVIDHESTAPPCAVGVLAVIRVSLVSVNGLSV